MPRKTNLHGPGLARAGDVLRAALDHVGMTQRELARKMKRPVPAISEIITGKKRITADTAFQLEKVLGVHAEFWLLLDMWEQLDKAKKRGRRGR